MDAYINGDRVRLDPAKSVGKGGEADVFDIGGGRAAKIFKPPSHPDFEGLPHEQRSAEQRIETHQAKLRQFPHNLPERVVTPVDLVTDRSGKRIIGYTMPFLRGAEVLMRYADKTFRQAGVANQTVVSIFRDLHRTVDGAHRASFVIGDFNDLNVLVLKEQAHLIDADSGQFGRFFCQVFTTRFVDPLLCDPKSGQLMLAKPHGSASDWYAYAVMLMQCFLFVDPYGGIYRPKEATKRIPHDTRPLHRITVFNPEVRYPKPAIPYGVLPDDLLQYFHLIFEKDQRGDFPVALIDSMLWRTCDACHTEHARNVCPNCQQAAPAAVKEVTTVRGNVTATRVYRTHGVILFAAHQGGSLKWVAHENNQYLREDGTIVISGGLDPQMRFRIKDKTTLIGKDGQLASITPNQPLDRLSVDSFGILPIFDANERARYWVTGGMLMRDGQLGPERIGDVLSGQTLFWVGPKFGFGFYRAGNLSVAFVFRADAMGIKDNLKLPPIRGQLVDSTCVFTDTYCWFFTTTREGGKTVNQCVLLDATGTVIAAANAMADDGSWLSNIRGNCAAGKFLLVATDEGIVRVEPQGNQLAVTRSFPDTEPFVEVGAHLFADPRGVYVVGKQDVHLLKMS